MSGGSTGSTVHLSIPADGEYLATARLVVADLASRMGMPMDVIEDLRIAVDEVITMLTMGLAAGSAETSDGRISCEFRTSDEGLHVVAASSGPVAVPPRSGGGFAWIVLEAVCDEVDVEQGPDSTRIWFRRADTVAADHDGPRDSEDVGI